jgi:2-haloacid dehalogenase
MSARPPILVFDVNGTLSDMPLMQAAFVEVGAPPSTAELWFGTVLRDGFALTAAGHATEFARIADGALRVILTELQLDRDVDAAVEHVMRVFMDLPPHPDVPDAVRALAGAGLRLVTLSVGSADVAERLLTSAGVRDQFTDLLCAQDAGAWKPARAAYEYAARTCAASPGDLLLVAAHPWDIDGAARAGMATAWVNRTGALYPPYLTPPEHTVTALTELPALLTG